MRHSAFTLWLIPLILPLVVVCSPGARDPMGLGDLGDGMKVLFIGNSLTYANDLPEMVQIVGEAAGHEIAVRSVAIGNYSLEDHWLRGDAQEAIQAADWDVVVLQQGPSSLAINKIHLKEWTQRFDTIIRAQGARPALYMVWPEASRPAAFNAVTDAYTKAADAVQGMLFPVGEAWRAAWSTDPGLVFYGPDGFHPTELGSALAALVIFQQLFGESPVGLPNSLAPTTKGLPTLNIPSHLNTLLQEAAAQANAEFGRR
jgi:hypothetical protein